MQKNFNTSIFNTNVFIKRNNFSGTLGPFTKFMDVPKQMIGPIVVGGFDDDSKLPVVAHIMIIFDDDDWPLLDFRVFILFFELQQCCKCNTTS